MSRVETNGETTGGWRAELVGKRIREQRGSLGWSQLMLAERLSNLGISTSEVDVSRRERGVRRLTVDALLAYTFALDCSIVDLLADDKGEIQMTSHEERALPPPRKLLSKKGGRVYRPLSVVTFTRDEFLAAMGASPPRPPGPAATGPPSPGRTKVVRA